MKEVGGGDDSVCRGKKLDHRFEIVQRSLRRSFALRYTVLRFNTLLNNSARCAFSRDDSMRCFKKKVLKLIAYFGIKTDWIMTRRFVFYSESIIVER